MARRGRFAVLAVVLLATLGAGHPRLNEAGKAAYAKGDFAAAERLFRQALAQAPSDPVLHYNRANALVQMGRLDEAGTEYEAALRLGAPRDVAAAARRSLQALGHGQPRPARPRPEPDEPTPVRRPAPQEGEIPLAQGPGGWVAQAEINGRVTGRFLVDTGASTSVISPRVAEDLDLRIGDRAPTVQLTTIAGATSGPQVSLSVVRVGDIEARDVNAVVHEVHKELDGILGNNFLGRYTVTLDPERKVLRLTSR